MAEIIIYIIEIIGTVAFAVSGAMIAIDRKLDLFGVLFLGVMTALGGGVVRDLLIGQIPPAMFVDYIYFLVAASTSLIVFILVALLKNKYRQKRELIEKIFNIFDAIGLGIFAVVGVTIAVNAGYRDNGFLCVFVGMSTAVGGGMIRDMMSTATPMVLHKRIYAVAAILGSVICYVMLYFNVASTISMAVGAAVVFIIRILAAHYKWNLPHIELDKFEDKL